MKEMVLVSGGAGYIGSHTAVELINAGYDVVVADNLSNSDMSGVEGVRKITGVDVPFVNVDCCDKEAFRKVFEQYNFTKGTSTPVILRTPSTPLISEFERLSATTTS